MPIPAKRPAPAALASQPVDLLVVGGGITGAGILRQAAAMGLKAVLVEKQDFAWGTSSRSSKMVHGGLRYIAQGDVRLTRESLLERERLLNELPELVQRHTYLFPARKGQFPGRWPMTALLWLYDRLAGIRDHRWVPKAELLRRVPGLKSDDLSGAMSYTDALTDDCRLVLRTLHEACDEGAQVCNYLSAEKIRADGEGFAVTLKDTLDGSEHVLKAGRVINATGAWADRLSGESARVRPLRGSHLFVSAERLPVKDCLTILHPRDKRPVFIFPWEGLTCIGTTDLDHRDDPDREPRASSEEVSYLLEMINSQFPNSHLKPADIISTMAGVRPVIASGKGVDPSKERRDHAVWVKDGVVTVSGGKLTTFRIIALDALHAAGLIDESGLRRAKRDRSAMYRHTLDAPAGLGAPLAALPDGQQLLGQLQWVLDNEMVVHLDDLLLRRTRIGNLISNGGRNQLPEWQALICSALEWDEARWQRELTRYGEIIDQYYSVPPGLMEDQAA